MFPQIEVNSRFSLHFLTSDSGKLSIFCIHSVPQRNTITVLLLFRLGQSQAQTDFHTRYGHLYE